MKNITVYILCEEVDVIAVFTSRELAIECAKENELRNYYIKECILKGIKWNHGTH